MEVQNQCLIISNRMSRSGYMSEESRDSTVDVELDTIAAIFNGRIVVVNRNFKVIKDTFRLAEGRTHVAEEVIRCFQGESGSRLERDKHYFALAVPIYNNTEEKNITSLRECWWPPLPRGISWTWRSGCLRRRHFSR